MDVVVGVDGTHEGWVAVCLAEGRFARAELFKNFRELVRAFSRAAIVAVDIPVAAPARGRRPADEAARKLLGRLASSVFITPPREALQEPTFNAAQRTAQRLGGVVTQQSYALRHKIEEVEEVARSDPRLREVHPEVSFWAMNGRTPLAYRKRTWNGLVTRLSLLRKHGIELPETPLQVGDAAPDDVLDAAAAAWSAWRCARGWACSLPHSPPVDEAGRAVAIWF
jgi:predicted RNase H-like nuclease